MSATGRIPPAVRAIFFDAVGTLIHPHPSPGDVYATIGRRFGSRRDPAEIHRRFAEAFKAQEEYDRRQGLRSDEERERQRWKQIVAAVLDTADAAGCFTALYEHFALPASWRCEPHTTEVLDHLAHKGWLLGMASNFDHRLHGVVRGLPELARIERLLISSEVGWKKPAREFYERLCESIGLLPEQVLLVGDDRENDYDGARRAGLRALLFDPRRRGGLPAEEWIADLLELIA